MLKKLFGKKLFGHNKPTVLYDFAQHGLLRDSGEDESMMMWELRMEDDSKKKKKKIKKKPEVNPKDLFKLESLNDNEFLINTDSAYITKQVKNVEKKINLIYDNRNHSGDHPLATLGGSRNHYAQQELESIKQRLENRRRIDEFTDILEKYPHTTSALINDVVKEHSNL